MRVHCPLPTLVTYRKNPIHSFTAFYDHGNLDSETNPKILDQCQIFEKKENCLKKNVEYHKR